MWFDIKKDLLFTRFILMIIKLEISRISSFVGLYLRSGNLSRLYNGEVIWGQSSRIVGECFVGPLRPFGIKKYKFVWNYNWGGYPFQMLPSCITPLLPSYLVFNIQIQHSDFDIPQDYSLINLEIFFFWSRWKRFMKPSFVNAADRKWYLRRYPVGVRI